MRRFVVLVVSMVTLVLVCCLTSFAVDVPAKAVGRDKRLTKLKIPTGVKLCVTNLTVDNITGYIQADVANQGAPMTRDAKVRIYVDNVQIAEYDWPKNVRKRSCCRRAFEDRNPPAFRKCTGGKSDRQVHVQIIVDPEEHVADNSGHYKKTFLHAKQDLAAVGLYKDPGNRVGVLVANKGICESTTWSFKVYYDNELKQTSGTYSFIPGGGFTRVLLTPQPPSDVHNIMVDIIPTDPAYDSNSNNNQYVTANGINAATSNYDMVALDLKFQGEVRWWYETEIPGFCALDGFYLIMPTLRNIGTQDMPANHWRFEVLIDGVSQGEHQIYLSCKKDDSPPESHPCYTNDILPILPPGTHTVKFKIISQDAQNGNNIFQKVMTRP